MVQKVEKPEEKNSKEIMACLDQIKVMMKATVTMSMNELL